MWWPLSSPVAVVNSILILLVCVTQWGIWRMRCTIAWHVLLIRRGGFVDIYEVIILLVDVKLIYCMDG